VLNRIATFINSIEYVTECEVRMHYFLPYVIRAQYKLVSGAPAKDIRILIHTTLDSTLPEGCQLELSYSGFNLKQTLDNDPPALIG